MDYKDSQYDLIITYINLKGSKIAIEKRLKILHTLHFLHLKRGKF